MARGRNTNTCRLCMKSANRNDLSTINNLPKTFAHILDEISGIKFSEADGLKIRVCPRCQDFLQAMENYSQYPKANKISGSGKRKVRRLMDSGLSASEAIDKVIAEKRARELLSGASLPVQDVNVPNIVQKRSLSGAQRKKMAKLVDGGMNIVEARALVMAASAAMAVGANQPQQRRPAVGRPIQRPVVQRTIVQRPNGSKAVIQRTVVQRPNGPRTAVRASATQGGRVQKVARGLVANATQRLNKTAGILKRGPLQKERLPQKPKNGPAQNAPVNQKTSAPKKPANNAQPRQQQPVATGGRPQNIDKRPTGGRVQNIDKRPGAAPPRRNDGAAAPRRNDGAAPPRRNDRPVPYNNRGNNQQNQNQNQNRNKYGSGNDNFNQQNCPLEVGIVPFNFPSVQLDEMKLDALKEAITNEIFKIPPGGPLVRFLGTTFENGWLKLICADQFSYNWLASLVSRWERAGVRLVEGNALPQPVVLSLYLPGDFRSPEEILGILERQNNSLNTNQWRIINREIDANGQSITVCVDEQSFQALQSRDFMVFLGVGMVEFKPRRFPTEGGTFNNTNMRGQSNNNQNNSNNMKNNSMGYSNGGNNNNGGGGGGGNRMGNNYQPNQNWLSSSGAGSFNKRQGMSQGQGYQRGGYQNQRSW